MVVIFVVFVILAILAFLSEVIGVGWTIALVAVIIALFIGACCLLDTESTKKGEDNNKDVKTNEDEKAQNNESHVVSELRKDNSKPDENEIVQKNKKEKDDINFNKKNALGYVFLVLIVILIIGVIIGAIVGFSDSTYESPEKSAYDDAMGSYDWGDDYYYDSSDGVVKKKPW